MAMQDWGMAAVVVAVLIANVPAVMQQWREDRPGLIRTLWMAAAYVAYVGVGIWLLLGVMAPVGSKGPHVLFAIGFLLVWILYGGLALMHVVPRYRELPRWLTQFGVIDVIVLATLFGCLVGYLWVR
jgi:hypothetical protein